MTQTLKERAEHLAAHCRNPEEMLEHLRAVEQAATKAAYERAAETVRARSFDGCDYTVSNEINTMLFEIIQAIRALADGGKIDG